MNKQKQQNKEPCTHTYNVREHREDRNTKHRNKLYSTFDLAHYWTIDTDN